MKKFISLTLCFSLLMTLLVPPGETSIFMSRVASGLPAASVFNEQTVTPYLLSQSMISRRESRGHASFGRQWRLLAGFLFAALTLKAQDPLDSIFQWIDDGFDSIDHALDSLDHWIDTGLNNPLHLALLLGIGSILLWLSSKTHKWGQTESLDESEITQPKYELYVDKTPELVKGKKGNPGDHLVGPEKAAFAKDINKAALMILHEPAVVAMQKDWTYLSEKDRKYSGGIQINATDEDDEDIGVTFKIQKLTPDHASAYEILAIIHHPDDEEGENEKIKSRAFTPEQLLEQTSEILNEVREQLETWANDHLKEFSIKLAPEVLQLQGERGATEEKEITLEFPSHAITYSDLLKALGLFEQRGELRIEEDDLLVKDLSEDMDNTFEIRITRREPVPTKVPETSAVLAEALVPVEPVTEAAVAGPRMLELASGVIHILGINPQFDFNWHPGMTGRDVIKLFREVYPALSSQMHSFLIYVNNRPYLDDALPAVGPYQLRDAPIGDGDLNIPGPERLDQLESHARTTSAWKAFWFRGGVYVEEVLGHAERAAELRPDRAREVSYSLRPEGPYTRVPWLSKEETAKAMARGDIRFFEEAEDLVNVGRAALRKYFHRAWIDAAIALGADILLGVQLKFTSHAWVHNVWIVLMAALFMYAVFAAYMAVSIWLVHRIDLQKEAKDLRQAQFYRAQNRWQQIPDESKRGFRTLEEVGAALNQPYMIVRVTAGDRKDNVGIIVGELTPGNLKAVFPRISGPLNFSDTSHYVRRSDIVPVDPKDPAFDRVAAIFKSDPRIQEAAELFMRQEKVRALQLLEDFRFDAELAEAMGSGNPLPEDPDILRSNARSEKKPSSQKKATPTYEDLTAQDKADIKRLLVQFLSTGDKASEDELFSMLAPSFSDEARRRYSFRMRTVVDDLMLSLLNPIREVRGRAIQSLLRLSVRWPTAHIYASDYNPNDIPLLEYVLVSDMAVLIYPGNSDASMIMKSFNELWPSQSIMDRPNVIIQRQYEGFYLAHRLIGLIAENHLNGRVKSLLNEFSLNVNIPPGPEGRPIHSFFQRIPEMLDTFSYLNKVRESGDNAGLMVALEKLSPGAEWTSLEMADLLKMHGLNRARRIMERMLIKPSFPDLVVFFTEMAALEDRPKARYELLSAGARIFHLRDLLNRYGFFWSELSWHEQLTLMEALTLDQLDRFIEGKQWSFAKSAHAIPFVAEYQALEPVIDQEMNSIPAAKTRRSQKELNDSKTSEVEPVLPATDRSEPIHIGDLLTLQYPTMVVAVQALAVRLGSVFMRTTGLRTHYLFRLRRQQDRLGSRIEKFLTRGVPAERLTRTVKQLAEQSLLSDQEASTLALRILLGDELQAHIAQLQSREEFLIHIDPTGEAWDQLLFALEMEDGTSISIVPDASGRSRMTYYSPRHAKSLNAVVKSLPEDVRDVCIGLEEKILPKPRSALSLIIGDEKYIDFDIVKIIGALLPFADPIDIQTLQALILSLISKENLETVALALKSLGYLSAREAAQLKKPLPKPKKAVKKTSRVTQAA